MSEETRPHTAVDADEGAASGRADAGTRRPDEATTNRLIERVGTGVGRAWRRIRGRPAPRTPRQIAAYRGYGNLDRVWVQGRVLANRPVWPAEAGHGWWANLRASFRRWETDEVPGADVSVDYGRQTRAVTTNREGYYRSEFARSELEPAPRAATAVWQGESVTLEGQHELTLLEPGAEYLVISDMDDTVIHTGITRRLRAARLTFLENAKSRKPLDGVAALYRQLASGADGNARNPVFYVSNSGWNMYDLLNEFVELNELPQGPLLLRDLGLEDDVNGRSTHKRDTLMRLLDRYAPLPAVLIGDSGQHDAEIYAEIARAYPGRIIAIYIRDVDPNSESAYDSKVDAIIEDFTDSGVPMLRGRDSRFFAAHLEEIGLVPPGTVADVAASVGRERLRTDPSEP